MACRYTYNGKTYEAHEFDDVLRAMAPSEASKFMPGVESIPSAPFVQKTDAWTALVLKRMIRYAAEHGFDSVAWTTGEQQVKRYESALRKHVDQIEWKKTPQGIHLVGYKGKKPALTNQQTERLAVLEARNQNTLTGHEIDEIVRMRGVYGYKKVVDTTQKEDALSDAIGKVMADRIIADPNQSGTIEGKNITIDKTGMAGYYGKIMPAVANGILKKLGGGKVGEVSIPKTDDGVKVDARELTDAAVEYMNGGTTNDELREIAGIDLTDLEIEEYLGGYGERNARQRSIAAEFARDIKLRLAAGKKMVQPGFAITPEMRDKVMAGQPLFSRAVRSEGFPADIGDTITTFGRPYVAANLRKHPDYAAAKAGDAQAALRFVRDMITPANITEAKSRFDKDTIFVGAKALEKSGLNKIPDAMAAHYAHAIGARADTHIIETNRAYHTGAGRLERLISRPLFDGTVLKGSKYVLVDDVVTMGGTLAELADHIRAGGGEVAGAIVLSDASKTGKLAAPADVVARLERRFGDEIRNQFQVEPAALTADEALTIDGLRNVDDLRNRAGEARQGRSLRLSEEGVSGPSDGVTPSGGAPIKGPQAPQFSRNPGFFFDAKSSPLYKTRTAAQIGVISTAKANEALQTDATARRILEKGITPQPGDVVGVRLNLNVLKKTGVPVMTIHKGSKGDGYKSNRGLWGGEAITYQPVVTVKDAYLNVHQAAREKIATGADSKSPMASVDGKFSTGHSFDGVEFRFNPKREHLFRDGLGRVLKRADEVTLYGNSVYARGEIEYYGPEDVPARAGDAATAGRLMDPENPDRGAPQFSRGESSSDGAGPSRSLPSQTDPFSPGAKTSEDSTPQFSRAPAIAGSQTTGSVTDSILANAVNFTRDLLHTDHKMGWWARSVGTQQHKALTNAEFAPVYEEGQAFIGDQSKFANESADLAPSLLPRIDGFGDFAKKSATEKEIERVTEATYAGTLFGSGSPLEGRKWTDAELRTGRAEDGQFSIPAFTPLNEREIELYHELMNATAHSLDTMGVSLIHKLAIQHDIGFDRDMALDDVAQVVRDQVEDEITDRSVELEEITDPKYIADMAGNAADEAGDDRAGERAAAKVRRDLEKRAKKLQAEIDELEALKTGVDDIEKKITGLKDHGYFPAQRFGQYAIQILDKNGRQLHFSMYETEREANKAERELRKEFPKDNFERMILPDQQYKMFMGMSMDTFEAFADKITGEDGSPISKDPLMQAFFKAAASERSVMKRHIHRKGTAGFNRDLPRVLANFVVSSARATSSNYHSAQMAKLAGRIRAGDVQDEANKLVKYLLEPKEEAQALRGFLFAQFLGGSIAHGIVNMSQPFLVTGPYLTQFTSVKDAAAKLGAAMTTKQKDLTGRLKDDYERAKKEGIVSPQEIHQLRAEASGMAMGRSLLARKFGFIWGSIYSITEQFNRSTSFIAAYRIAQEKGMRDPYAFAVETVNQTQFVYNKGNRPNAGRGALGATVMTFKQFSISYLELAKRLYDRKGPDGKADRKAFAMLLLMLLAAAGLEGLPFAEDIEDLIDTIGQWMGYGTNSKKKLRQWATAVLGPDMAQVALKGVSGLPFMPVDISVRMGMANLIPGTAMLKPSEKNKARDVLEILGPAGQLVPTDDTMVGKALDRLAHSDWYGAVKAGAPIAVQNLAKGAEMLDKGYATDSKGKKITDVSATEAVFKMAGLQPASVARESAKIGVVAQDIAIQRKTEADIAERWARGIVDGDPADVRAARQQLADWNKDNPELRIRIQMSQIARRVKEMKLPRETRFIKSAPPEMRPGVREGLR